MSTTAPSPDRFLSPPEVAERLGVSPEKVLHWVRSGELRGIDLSTRRGVGRVRVKIDPSDLEAFLSARAVVARPPATRLPKRKVPAWVREWV